MADKERRRAPQKGGGPWKGIAWHLPLSVVGAIVLTWLHVALAVMSGLPPGGRISPIALVWAFAYGVAAIGLQRRQRWVWAFAIGLAGFGALRGLFAGWVLILTNLLVVVLLLTPSAREPFRRTAS